ncbi:MAG: tyrosine-type recombinase/integrase [Isosphaeraceae bacterium]
MNPLGYADFRQNVLAYYRFRAPTTYLKARQVLDALERLGVHTTADLTTETALAFVADRGPEANPRTTAGLLGYLRAICSLAIDEGWLDRPPSWRRCRPRPGPPPPRKSLDGVQVGRLLAHLARDRADWAGHRLETMVAVAVHTGLRYQELARLTVEDLDLVVGVATVRARGRRLKTAASAGTVPLSTAAVEALRAWTPRIAPGPWVFPGAKGRGPWSGGSVGYRPVDRLAAACRAAGVPVVTWHGLRHTFAWVATREWGLPVWAVQRILRHTSPRTTEGYLRGDDTPALVALTRGLGFQSGRSEATPAA